MPWAPPAWCRAPGPGAPRAVVTLQSQRGPPRRHDISDEPFYLLTREPANAAAPGSAGDSGASSWNAAVLRDESGKCFIMSLGSGEGTFLQGRALEPGKPCAWEPGTVVVLGMPRNHDKATLEVTPSGHSLKRGRDEKDVAEKPAHPKKKRLRRDPLCPQESATPSEEEEEEPATRARPAAKPDADGVRVAPAGGSGASASAGAKKCDKCDGPHPTDACPHFKKPRDGHKDAWVNYGQKCPLQMGKGGGKFVLRSGKPVPQPGDGSCLFHSLCFGLNGGRSRGSFVAGKLRKELAHFIQQNPRVRIAGDTIEEWVRWDANTSVSSYVRRIAAGGWGGGIEMAACALLKKVNIHVYERRRGGSFQRISCFDSPERTKSTIHVLYQGGVHYDALIPH
mmetsp:Transcript_41784/g.118127  ORF Transcript_41784/g.118127 Transcript_41784/m.118127 type:complete len:395 (-) Transcript_41784:64-1248(-)